MSSTSIPAHDPHDWLWSHKLCLKERILEEALEQHGKFSGQKILH